MRIEKKNMKKTLTLLLALITISSFAQVTVEEKKVSIEGPKNGFYVSIPYGDQKIIEKALKDELKSWKGKYSDKKFIFVDDCELKEMGDNTFDVYAKVEENPEGGGFVSIAIDLGGAILNSSEHPSQAKAIDARLHKFGVKTAKDVINDEIKEEEKILKERDKELKDLEKDQKKLEDDIEDLKKQIEKNKEAIEESKKAQEAKKEEIKKQKEKVKATEKKKNAVK